MILKKFVIRSLILFVSAGYANAAQNTWYTWSGKSVGVPNATFFGIENKEYFLQLTCFSKINSESSSLVLYYGGKALDEFKVAINGHVYESIDGQIEMGSRLADLEFNKILDDIKTGKDITFIDGSASIKIKNNKSKIIPNPYGNKSCK